MTENEDENHVQINSNRNSPISPNFQNENFTESNKNLNINNSQNITKNNATPTNSVTYRNSTYFKTVSDVSNDSDPISISKITSSTINKPKSGKKNNIIKSILHTDTSDIDSNY